MHAKKLVAVLIGTVVLLRDAARSDQRGLSQSAESAILLAGAVTIAGIVIALVTSFVRSKLGAL